jgi:hypothetical protein
VIKKFRGDKISKTLSNSDPEKVTGVGARAINKVLHAKKHAETKKLLIITNNSKPQGIYLRLSKTSDCRLADEFQ